MAYSDPERPVDPEMLARMTDMMIHRGPDSKGFYLKPGIGLGIRRLSIIDLETGDQPISNEDGTVTVVCNGEIYNFKELRQELEASGHRFRTRSDVEVIVHLYEENGVDCLKRLRGMFGFALWDQNNRRLMLARDRIGIKPLCYAYERGALYFGSEQKAILKSEKIDREIDPSAVKNIFTIGFPVAPKTLFKKIRRLLPGQFLIYQKGKLSHHQYWTPRFPNLSEESPKQKEHEWAEALKEKLTDSVRIHLRSDVPLGAFLSAGIDSSTVVALMHQITDQPIHTFSIGFENRNYDEISKQKILTDFPNYPLKNDRILCKTKDIELIQKTVWHREDPCTLGTEVPRFILAQLASSKNIKVVLLGEGSDEIFGGYRWFQTEKIARLAKQLPFGLPEMAARIPLLKRKRFIFSKLLGTPLKMDFNRYSKMIYYSNFDDSIFSNDLREKLKTVPLEESEPCLPSDFYEWHPFSQLQFFELTIRLPDLILRNVDSTSMANSVEARVPFLDHELIEFCSQVPVNLKMRGFQEKYILRRSMNGVLPQEIISRKKRPLTTPTLTWLRNLPQFALDLLTEGRIQEKGLFDRLLLPACKKIFLSKTQQEESH